MKIVCIVFLKCYHENMKIDFSPIIKFSFERTKTILFQPFNLRKWVTLALIAWLSGQLSIGGGNGGGNFFQKRDSAPSETETSWQLSTPDFHLASDVMEEKKFVHLAASSGLDEFKQMIESIKSNPIVLAIGGIVILFVSILVMLLAWIGSIFFFVFLDDIIKNKVNIKQPFIQLRGLGTSYFLWNLVFGLVFLVLFAGLGFGCFQSLSQAGVFEHASEIGFFRILGIAAPFLFIFAFLFIVSMLIHWFVQNFVLPIMFKNNISIMRAWPEAFVLLKINLKEILLYLLICMGFAIAGSILAMIIGLIILLIVGFLVVLLGFAIYFALNLLPSTLQVILGVIFAILGGIFLFLLFLSVNFLFLPIPVFFRTFNLKFLGELEPRYNLLSEIS
ncbi:MAG: hypothetical protein ABIJ41_00585 [Candidatus Omnitrophota bacterium]